jgi:hypothetical protein
MTIRQTKKENTKEVKRGG